MAKKDKNVKIEIPFFNEISEDWESHKRAQPYPFKDQLAEGMAFMSFGMGWLYSRLRSKNETK